jgi:uncharacterized protein YfdQ (DUF2303 family)
MIDQNKLIDNVLADLANEGLAKRSDVKIMEGFHPFVPTHENTVMRSLEAFAEKPYRTEARRHFIDIPAFVQYVNDFGNAETTRIFAGFADRELDCVIDYHKPNGEASHCSHQAMLRQHIDCDLKEWLDADGEMFSQQRLLSFLVDYAHMVKDVRYKVTDEPQPISRAEFLELVASIKAIKSTDLESLASVGGSGELKFAASKKVTSGGRELPEVLSIGLPAFRNGAEYHFDFRIMCEVDDSRVAYGIKMIRPQVVIEQAFKDVCKEVQAGIEAKGLKIYGL